MNPADSADYGRIAEMLRAKAEGYRTAPSPSVYKDGRADGLEYAALLIERLIDGSQRGD